MGENTLYHERISSNKTEALFLALMVFSLLLFAWRFAASGMDMLAAGMLVFSAIFLFYSLNYRTLTIYLTPDALHLTFGIFTWRVPLDNIAECRLDEIPPFMRIGGAGIHFMMIRKRYRASFNFLEFPRVVVALKRKAGLVQDISFSTRQPDKVLKQVQNTLTAAIVASSLTA